NNDNLAVPLASLALLLMIRIVTRRREGYFAVGWRGWAAVGLVIGLAVLTKAGTIGVLPMAFGTAVVAAWQRMVASGKGDTAAVLRGGIKPAARVFLSAIIFVMLPVLLVAGWWYYRNIVLYGDWLGWNAFIAVLGERGHPASLLQLWGERRGFLMSFWGLFGGVNIPMASWIYAILNAVLV